MHVRQQHEPCLQACGNACAQVLCCLQLSAVLMHDEGSQAVQLIEVCLLQDLPPCVHISRQHADAIPQEVQDQPKVLWVPVNEDASLYRHIFVS